MHIRKGKAERMGSRYFSMLQEASVLPYVELEKLPSRDTGFGVK